MDDAPLESRIARIPYWYHRIELPGGVVTPGWAPLAPQAYRIPDSLEGKRVLDVGAWDGYWTFAALDRGASEVVAIDDFSDRLGFLDESVRRDWSGFDLCRQALGYGAEVCRREELSVVELTPEHFGRFDVVFFFGTLYHVRYPLLALDRLSAVCDGEIYVESAILDDFSPYRGGLGKGYPGGQMVMELYPERQYGDNPANWWVPTLTCLGHMLRVAGFTDVAVWRLVDEVPDDVRHCRGFARAKKA